MRTALRTIILAIREAWNPTTALFGNGEVGVFYDPSDFSTLYQDSAGTTPVTAVEQPVGLILDKSGNGKHASQSTAASRPTLSQRVNLLTKTEVFSDAAWVKAGVTVTANVTTAPDGTLTADQLNIPGAGTEYADYVTSISASNLSNYRGSIFLKGSGQIRIATATTTDPSVERLITLTSSWVSYATDISPNTTGNIIFRIIRRTTEPAPSSLYIWGASLVPADQAALGYQRVNTSTDYATVGFPEFTNYDAVDDVLNTTFASSLGTDCTVARAVVGGAPVILTGQTIGTSYATSTDNAGLVIVNRALTAGETASLTAYLTNKGAS